MALDSGSRLGVYQVLGLLGAGGMGEVYRALDTRLDRQVAIKVLPDAVRADPERVARFEREAKLLASLNHQHIASIYGLEQASGEQFIVMELVEGPTLADHIAEGPIPVTEALRIAKQIAEALEAAHDAGVIHRDLKPANVKVRPDGVVKVLDFGLAKPFEPADFAVNPQSLTIITPALLTAVGVLVGTASYMSPEQASAKALDKRTDIWAFGCVLYEMLTGHVAFKGATVSDTIAAILASEPNWDALPVAIPPGMGHLLRRCLDKNPIRRLHDIGDARIEVEDALAAPLKEAADPIRGPRRSLAIIAAIIVIVGGIIGWMMRPIFVPTAATPADRKLEEVRLEISTPPTIEPVSIAMSPDGGKVVFVASLENRSLLWMRSLSSVAARSLPGTEDATLPFWSPDSRSIAFFAAGKLKRLDIEAGTIRTLASASPMGARGGTWNRDGTILYQPEPGNWPLLRIADSGGEPVAVAQRGRFPQFLPDGRHFIYYVPNAWATVDEPKGIYVGELDGTNAHRLLDADAAGVYSVSGNLLFIRRETLLAQPFDPVTLTLSGNPFPVAGDIGVSQPELVGALSASAAGAIVYRTGSAARLRQFVWLDRSGKTLERVGEPAANLLNPALSPDGTRVAIHRTVDGNADIWLLDLRRGILSRFTSNPEAEFSPVWSPDGTRLAFNSTAVQYPDLYTAPSSGIGTRELLLKSPVAKTPTAWSPDGRFLLYHTNEPNPNSEIWALPQQQDQQPFLVVHTTFNARNGQFSPDGKWIAYVSDESGRDEIYVQPFPGPGSKTPVSSDGGAMVRWRHDGRELFYVGLDNRLMAVPVVLGTSTIESDKPVPLFTTSIGEARQLYGPQYVVASGGQRFLMNTVAEGAASPITVILNWKAKP